MFYTKLVKSFKCRYVLRVILKSPKLNLGSIPAIRNSSLLIQKQTILFSCWSVTKMHIASGALWRDGINGFTCDFFHLHLSIITNKGSQMSWNLKLEICFLFLGTEPQIQLSSLHHFSQNHSHAIDLDIHL